MSDLISRQAAIEAVHKSIFDFFDICDDDEESPMTYKDELLLELNKAITTQIKAVASAPTIEAEPKHAHVIVDEDGNTECSNCGSGNCFDNYCGHCGAKLKR